jgi:RimJ/RimL family protein N-acetyltransferase
VAYGFNILGMIKIYAGCFDFNHASQRVLLKAGFLKEAILKNAVFKKEVLCDEIRYAIFNPE